MTIWDQQAVPWWAAAVPVGAVVEEGEAAVEEPVAAVVALAEAEVETLLFFCRKRQNPARLLPKDKKSLSSTGNT